jgi:tagaturonate reductase
MKDLNRKTIQAKTYPERVIQFGEGNFLRAFVDWIIYNMNEKADFNSSVVVVQPIDKGMAGMLNAQDNLYHVNLQGLDKGRVVNDLTLIDVISRSLDPYSQNEEFLKLADQPEMRFVISNTTEAGIAFDPSCKPEDAPASSYPGKLTQLLYRRFKTFNGDKSKGLIIFPCELIFLNGHRLKETIYQYIELWGLGDGFKAWFEEACAVYATLVDRIVPGFPRKDIDAIREKLQYNDNLVVQAEIFHLWVIEAPQEVANEFPADKAGLNVLFVPSEAPYHERKVCLLNGPHTVLSPVAYLSGIDIVRDACGHPIVGKYIRKVMYDELMETLNLPKDELTRFADDVWERFNNPFVDHAVTSIMLNSFPKFETRDLPGLKTYLERKGELPEGLVLGLAAIITYYKGGVRADGAAIVPNDAPEIMNLLKNLWATGDTEKVAIGVLAARSIWGEDLNKIPGLTAAVKANLDSIQEKGMLETVKGMISLF